MSIDSFLAATPKVELHLNLVGSDPHMFATNLTEEYRRVAIAFGLDVTTVATLVANGVRPSFLPSGRTTALLADIERCAAAAGGSGAATSGGS
jgi:adenosine deaminase